MDSSKWTIYCHTHAESGRRYIGLTKHTMLKRWNRHVYDATKSRYLSNHFHNAIRKYGKDSFEHQVLEICMDLETANAREDYWIESYDTRNPEKGFNLKRGGGHTPHPIKNPWDRPEFREKAILAAKRRAEDPSFIANMTAASRLMWSNPSLRKRASEISRVVHARPEVAQRMSAALTGRKLSPEHRAKISAMNVGKKLSPEHIASLKASNRSRDPDVRAKISRTEQGRIISEEHRQKISAALKGRGPSRETWAKICDSRRRRDDERIASRTHIQCKVHGQILLGDCIARFRNGRMRYSCKKCMDIYQNQWAKRRRGSIREPSP